MKTLYPKQEEAVQRHVRNLMESRASLDTSKTGTGKTVTSSHVARVFNDVCVVCPKIMIPAWKRELALHGVEPVFVLNYEKLRTGNTPFLSKQNKKFTWEIPLSTLIIWDEVHKCKGAVSQNAQMLIAAKGHHNLMLSATAAKDPTEMRALGYVLGLHSLTRDADGKVGWIKWMRQYGCRMDNFRNWVPGSLKHLVALNEVLYKRAVRLEPKDLPNAFMDNLIITEPLAFSNTTDIKAAYSDTVSEVLLEIVSGDRKPEPSVLTEILRARQLVEALKVQDTCSMISDALDEGFSVAVFVGFTDTVRMFLHNFPDAATIVGGQSATEREQNVAAFQSNQKRVIICNTAAGGAGVSLHDEHGGHPRMSLINPSYNPVDMIQTLGRIYRNGAKSNAVQRILVAAGTIEEEIISAIERKSLQYDTLHATVTPEPKSE